MKSFFTFILVYIFATAQAQKSSALHIAPEYYVDSVRISSFNLFNHDKIEKVNVIKGDSAAPSGKVYISIKKTMPLKWITINDIKTQYKLDDSADYLFMLNDNFIKDTALFRIDGDYLLRVEIIKASEIENLPNNFPDAKTLKLFTGSKEQLEEQKVVRIKNRESF